ncbi:MAG: 23S rRNA (guanosine(2251)-2'-O)-methyltransferase RlmB [Planctomycetota bacterium]
MVDSSRRRSSRRDVLTNHNRCWIWGRNVVLETLRAGRWPIIELLIGDRADDVLWDEAVRLAKQHGIGAIAMDDATLTKACHSGEHQGMAARMAPFPYATVEQLLGGLPADAMLVVLDRLQDPFNFGAIVRSASTLGLNGIVIGQKEQVEVNSLVARSSAGAVNHIAIASTDDLVQTVDTLRERGYQIVAASEKADSPLYETDFRQPTVAIIGNEGRGIRPELLARCDRSLSIPMSGAVGSLNAAVAAGILFYEMRRQRGLKVEG